MIAFIAPPGAFSAIPQRWKKRPARVPLADALILCALFNSFAFDWLVRQKAATHLSLYLLEALPVPRLRNRAGAFLAHAASAAVLRSCRL